MKKKSYLFTIVGLFLVLLLVSYLSGNIFVYPFCPSLPPYEEETFDWDTYHYSVPQENCIIQGSISRRDPNLCYKVPSLRTYNCLEQFAMKVKDPEICNEISDGKYSLEWNACYMESVRYNTTKDWCEYLRDNFKDGCYAQLARGKKDENICLKINTSPNPKFWCIIDLAILKNDEYICDLLDETMPSNMSASKCREAIKNPSRIEEVKSADRIIE